MYRFLLPLLPLVVLPGCATTQQAPSQTERAERWWSDVATLADDGMEGRLTGTPGYQRSADYVVAQAKAIGLEPAGDNGSYFQRIAFEEQFVDHAASTAMLASGGRQVKLDVPNDLTVGRGGGRVPARVDAPLVFAGYGLHIPEAGHDDFAGLDLKGKIVVVIGGGPENISGALKAHARRDRTRLLAERGALGVLALTTLKAVETPWSRAVAQVGQGGMYFADPELRDVKTPFVSLSFNPETSQKLFAASGTSFAALSALADASRPLPRIDFKANLRGSFVATQRPVVSSNIVARLPGRDARMEGEHVVFSAHLDHLGVSAPINGDGLYNGAMDNAAGVAGLLDIARSYKARGKASGRSMLFVWVTAEEKGLLGSRYFALRPTVPKRSMVANLNFDMALPIFPLKSVIALGAEESSLGATAAEVGQAMGLPLVPDPWPDRNSFVRSDQYSFIREGVPALAFKFGFARGTAEAEIERSWRSTRYHAPSDDLSQPVEKLDAVRLHDFVAELGWRVANAPGRPTWGNQSFFRRFAQE
ncbi:MAG TPA: M28 family metallopeptidase [Allosphingosinicella sp.]|nr:M28 family metallopeptidase [Allosphingosinicella sp.]